MLRWCLFFLSTSSAAHRFSILPHHLVSFHFIIEHPLGVIFIHGLFFLHEALLRHVNLRQSPATLGRPVLQEFFCRHDHSVGKLLGVATGK